MNYYRSYYQSERLNTPTTGESVRRTVRDQATRPRTGSEAQRAYHAALLAFLNGKGAPTYRFDRPRSVSDCSSKINAMRTVIRKNGWEEEFYGRETEKC